MLTMNHIQALHSMSPKDVYMEVRESVFSSLEGLGFSDATLDVAVLFYLAYKSEHDDLLEYIVNHLKRYGDSQESLVFAHVITELSSQMSLTMRDSLEMVDMVQKIITKIYNFVENMTSTSKY